MRTQLVHSVNEFLILLLFLFVFFLSFFYDAILSFTPRIFKASRALGVLAFCGFGAVMLYASFNGGGVYTGCIFLMVIVSLVVAISDAGEAMAESKNEDLPMLFCTESGIITDRRDSKFLERCIRKHYGHGGN